MVRESEQNESLLTKTGLFYKQVSLFGLDGSSLQTGMVGSFLSAGRMIQLVLVPEGKMKMCLCWSSFFFLWSIFSISFYSDVSVAAITGQSNSTSV